MNTVKGRQDLDAANRRNDRIIAWLIRLIVLGLVALLWGFALRDAWREVAFQRIAVETEGSIVALTEHRTRERDGRWSVSYFPVFQYTLPDGTVLQRRARAGGNPPSHAVGEAVRVRYDPARPAEAEIVSFMQTWFFSVLLGGVGALIGLVGLFVGYMTRDEAHGRAASMRPGLPDEPAAPAPKLSVPASLAGLRREDSPDGPRWIVQARWHPPAQAAPVLFESAPLPFDPTPQMKDMSTVQVRLGSGTPNGLYAMDLSFLRMPDGQAALPPNG
ncbi:MAG TPA: DUF3592 domain-containing protein [Roseomonas sp.]|nr:DUF3592 domain-containing protein [Roseomonas sp.]